MDLTLSPDLTVRTIKILLKDEATPHHMVCTQPDGTKIDSPTKIAELRRKSQRTPYTPLQRCANAEELAAERVTSLRATFLTQNNEMYFALPLKQLLYILALTPAEQENAREDEHDLNGNVFFFFYFYLFKASNTNNDTIFTCKYRTTGTRQEESQGDQEGGGGEGKR